MIRIRVDGARRFLLKVELNRLALHDRGAKHIRQFLFALAEVEIGATLDEEFT